LPLKDYYQLLEIPAAATPDEVKRAFRLQIARYHPDKVQHLGQEFQAMAADRAAELTEAYRILSDEGRRGEYDRARAAAGPEIAHSPAAASAPPPSAARQEAPPPATEPERTAPPPRPQPDGEAGPQFKTERASRDEFVHKATVGRVRNAVDLLGGYDSVKTPGFDLAWTPKKGFLGRTKGPRLLCKFVSRVDKDSVADTWTQATKSGKPDEDVCVFLMGTEVAPAGELATAIAEQRKRQRASKVALIPVDARNWDAHIPLDAPAFAKTLLARLKSGQ